MRGRKRDWAGVTQGNLTVLHEMGRGTNGNVLWECLCTCGARCVKPNKTLAAGVKSCSTTCGVSTSNAARAQHGQYESKEYKTWVSMKQRCLNSNHAHYHRYGGRGITLCDRWLTFENFFADVGAAPAKHMTIDRIDNNRGYEPGNVHWTTRRQQSNNREVTLRDSIDGVEMTLSEIAALYGVVYLTVFQRYKRGLRGQELITSQPVGRKPKIHTV